MESPFTNAGGKEADTKLLHPLNISLACDKEDAPDSSGAAFYFSASLYIASATRTDAGRDELSSRLMQP